MPSLTPTDERAEEDEILAEASIAQDTKDDEDELNEAA
jgi:hypothetical protein